MRKTILQGFSNTMEQYSLMIFIKTIKRHKIIVLLKNLLIHFYQEKVYKMTGITHHIVTG